MGLEIGRFIHEKLLGAAIFFGRVEWAQSEARILGYSPSKQREVLIKTHFNAAERSNIIYGNFEKGSLHYDRAFELLRNKELPQNSDEVQKPANP